MSTQLLDPPPGTGRIARAYQIALFVSQKDICEASYKNTSQLCEWFEIHDDEISKGLSREATRREIALRQKRAMVSRVALRLRKIIDEATTTNTEPQETRGPKDT